MAITPVPAMTATPPFPALPDRAAGTYNSKAFAFGTHMGNVFNNEFVAVAASAFNNATDAAQKAAAAASSETLSFGYKNNAYNSALAAADSALAAANYAFYMGGPVSAGKYSCLYYLEQCAALAAQAQNTSSFADNTAVVRSFNDASKKAYFGLIGWTTGAEYQFILPPKHGTVAMLSDLVPATIVRNYVSSSANIGAAQGRQLIDCINTITLTWTASVAALGNGWYTYIRNNGSGIVTLDAFGAEGINGALTIAVFSGQTYLVQCDGGTLEAILFDDSRDSRLTFVGGNGRSSSNLVRAFSAATVATGFAFAALTNSSGGLGLEVQVKHAGLYYFSFADVTESSDPIGITVNTTLDARSAPAANRVALGVCSTFAGGTYFASCEGVVRLSPGDVIRCTSASMVNGNDLTRFIAIRLGA